MKKILALLLALVMVFSLAACGSSNNPGTSNDPGTATPDASNPGTDVPQTPVYENMGTIMWLSNLSSGLSMTPPWPI